MAGHPTNMTTFFLARFQRSRDNQEVSRDPRILDLAIRGSHEVRFLLGAVSPRGIEPPVPLMGGGWAPHSFCI
jgi:hypothetical protein